MPEGNLEHDTTTNASPAGDQLRSIIERVERLTEEKLDRILADLRQTGTCSLKTGPFMWPEPSGAKS